MGIGSEKGGLIPVYDSAGKQRTGYKKDSRGQFVMSKLNAGTLEKLAVYGSGQYYRSSAAGDEIDLILKDISYLKRGALKTERIKRFKQLYQIFLGAGILLFMTAYLLPEGRNLA